MDKLQLIWLAILQGITELFPISSLGHIIIVPGLLGWDIDRDAPWFLPFVVALHLSTALALFIYFRNDWLKLLGAFFRDGGKPVSDDSKLIWLLVVGTIPAGILGLLLEHLVRQIFAGFTVAAIFLMINGAVLIIGDRLKDRGNAHTLAKMNWKSAFFIGCAQALAIIPGISRSGVTLLGGLAAGFNYESSARFSFLLATPIIGAAGVLEVPKLLQQHAEGAIPAGIILLCCIFSGVFSYLSTMFLMRYFKNHEIAALRPFGIYCLVAGGIALLLHTVL